MKKQVCNEDIFGESFNSTNQLKENHDSGQRFMTRAKKVLKIFVIQDKINGSTGKFFRKLALFWYYVGF